MNQTLSTVEVDQIETKFNNPRKNTKADAELIESVRQFGVRIPPIVTNGGAKGKEYQLVAGARRLNAAIATGLQTITVMVVDGTPEEIFEFTLCENANRKSLTVFEQVDAVNTLMKIIGDMDLVAERLSMTVPELRRLLLVNKISKGIKQLIIENDGVFATLSLNCLAVIAALPEDQQQDLFESWTYDAPENITVKSLKEYLNNRYRFDLSGAKWALEDDALGGIEACTTCKKQTGNAKQAVLFDEDAKSKKGVCMDPECWKKKTIAFAKLMVDSHMTANADSVIVDYTGKIKKDASYLPAKFTKDEKGKISVIEVGRDGQVKTYKAKLEKGEKLDAGKKKSETIDKTKQLHGLRIGIVLKKMQEYLITPAAASYVMDTATTSSLTALSVMNRQQQVQFNEPDKAHEDLTDGKDVLFSVGYGGEEIKGSIEAVLWHQTKNSLADNLGFSNSSTAANREDYAQWLATYTGFKFDDAFREAKIEKPDPKVKEVAEVDPKLGKEKIKAEKKSKKPAKKVDKIKKGTVTDAAPF